MTLSVVQYEDIVSLLHEVPPLVDQLEARHSGFADEVLGWLKRAEVALESNRVPAVSQVSAYRVMLIEAARGVRHQDVSIAGRPTVRKLRDATAGLVLQRGSDLLHAVIAERQAVFDEAQRIARQIVTIAEAKGLLPELDDGTPHQRALDHLRQRVAADADLATPHLHLVSLIGKTDVLIFLDRALAGVVRT